MKLGEVGTTTLAENVAALPKERYRVEKYLIADPADVDGDCLDDISELADPVGMSPVNAAAALALNDGAVAVPDTHTYDALAVGGYFKFALLGMDTDRPSVYFINAKTHPTHQTFVDDRNINRQRVILGAIAYRQNLVAPDGSQGVYRYSFNTLPSRYSFSFSLMERTHTLFAASMPLPKTTWPCMCGIMSFRISSPICRCTGNPASLSCSTGTFTPTSTSWC